ncbi:hypothetical protein DF044_01780 [Burkholderia contaminans]|nr:hypothetical protein DF044_01780 [Burkholderia contaminans]
MTNIDQSALDERARQLVREEVHACVSMLISDLSKLVASADPSVLREVSVDQDELFGICVQDDHKSAAEHEDYVLFENEYGEYVALQPEDDVKGNLTLENLEYFEHAGKFYVLPEESVDEIKELDAPDQAKISEIIASAKSREDSGDTDGMFFEAETEHAVLTAYLNKHYADDWYNDEQEAWRAACETNNIDPDTCEAYEHWIVSGWLAGKLEERGEMVNRDICGLIVWGRCTTGQAICMDGVIKEIARDLVN